MRDITHLIPASFLSSNSPSLATFRRFRDSLNLYTRNEETINDSLLNAGDLDKNVDVR